jgi:hypothetical protein
MIADVESEKPIAAVDKLESVYSGAEAQQCLRLSEKLFEARKERDLWRAQALASMQELAEIKEK